MPWAPRRLNVANIGEEAGAATTAAEVVVVLELVDVAAAAAAIERVNALGVAGVGVFAGMGAGKAAAGNVAAGRTHVRDAPTGARMVGGGAGIAVAIAVAVVAEVEVAEAERPCCKLTARASDAGADTDGATTGAEAGRTQVRPVDDGRGTGAEEVVPTGRSQVREDMAGVPSLSLHWHAAEWNDCITSTKPVLFPRSVSLPLLQPTLSPSYVCVFVCL
jgi:hypothetical protein